MKIKLRGTDKLKKLIANNYKIFLFGLSVGILIHGFFLANKYPNWDDMMQTWDTMNRASSGRWFLTVPASFSSSLSMSWLNGILAIMYVSASSCLIIETLEIKNKILKCLLVSFMLAFPSVTSTMFYPNSADGYYFGLLMICLACYVISNSSTWLGFVVGIVLCILSLGVYQAYLSIGCVILLIVLMQMIFRKSKIADIMKTAVKMLCFLAISLIGYLKATAQFAGDGGLLTYQNLNEIGHLNLSGLLAGIKNAYKEFIGYFFQDSLYVHGRVKYAIIVFFIIVFIFLLLNIIVVSLDKIRFIMLVFLLVLFPLACNLVYVMGVGFVHTLMKYGLVGAYLLGIKVMDQFLTEKILQNKNLKARMGKILTVMSCVCLLAVSYKYILNTNMVYTCAHIYYEQTYATAERLAARIESIPGYKKSDMIYLVGEIQYDVNESCTGWMDEKLFSAYTGLPNLIISNRLPLYMRVYLGFPSEIQLINHQELEVDKQGKLEEMFCYPDSGSMARLDEGIILVKLSDAIK